MITFGCVFYQHDHLIVSHALPLTEGVVLEHPFRRAIVLTDFGVERGSNGYCLERSDCDRNVTEPNELSKKFQEEPASDATSFP